MKKHEWWKPSRLSLRFRRIMKTRYDYNLRVFKKLEKQITDNTSNADDIKNPNE